MNQLYNNKIEWANLYLFPLPVYHLSCPILYLQPKCTCDVHGICVYFSVEFGSGVEGIEREEQTASASFDGLDTSPWSAPTHWQQSLLLFKVRARALHCRVFSFVRAVIIGLSSPLG